MVRKKIMLKQINNNIVQCSDIMTNQRQFFDMMKNAIDIVYCDPPWGDGMIKFFNTLNKKQTNRFSENLPQNKNFLERLAMLSFKSKAKFVCIENGNKWSAETEETFVSKNFVHVATINGFYDKPKKPMKLHLFISPSYKNEINTENLKSRFVKLATDKSGFELIECTFLSCLGEKIYGSTVLDPCCGFGLTARVAKKYNMNFYGNELNQKRLEKTIKVLNG